MILKLSWRNIWRNKRRTLITAASILFAVLFASFMQSLQEGAWNNMIDNTVNFYFGYAQVHKKGYWEEQTINKAFDWKAIKDKIKASEGVKEVIPRLESFALASTGEHTKGALVVGIAPEEETNLTGLKDRLVSGAYLEAQDSAAMVASGLAELLDLSLGDTLYLISQGYHGVNAAGRYIVKGMVKFPSPDLNKQLVYLPIDAAQWFYGADGLATSVVLGIDNNGAVDEVMQQVSQQLDTIQYELMAWQEMMPELLEAKALDSAGNTIVYFILYMIIAFGIFGTILMMTKERSYEFGVLIAIGMDRWKLALTVWLEIIMLALLGAFAGIVVSIPLVWYFHINPIRFSGEYAASMEKFGFEPIFPTTLDSSIFIMQAIIVLIMAALLAVYPWLVIRKLRPVEAMK